MGSGLLLGTKMQFIPAHMSDVFSLFMKFGGSPKGVWGGGGGCVCVLDLPLNLLRK